jgi:hypothetical protein
MNPGEVKDPKPAVLSNKEADVLHDKLKPKDLPTPKASRGLGAKEEQMNEQQTSSENGSDSPGG